MPFLEMSQNISETRHLFKISNVSTLIFLWKC